MLSSHKLPKYLKVAIKVALSNDSYPRKRHGAVLVRGGSIQTVGWNSLKSERSRHAEIHALQAADTQQLTGATLYVARVGMDNSPRLSAPCDACRAAIRAAQIKQVVYTLNGSDYGVWKVLDSLYSH